MLSGIRADWVKIQCLMIVGFTASLAGIVSLSRLGAVSPNTGEGLEFEVIAAVVIGGTGLYGGQGKILRTIIGVIIIALTRNFLNLARIEIFWQGFATGAIILGAVLLEALQRYIARSELIEDKRGFGGTSNGSDREAPARKNRRRADAARLWPAPLGELFVKVDEPTAAATLRAAWDAGIRYYDTAPYYGRGLSEIRVGRFLDAKPRSDFVLSTKAGRWFFPPADPDAFETGFWAGGLRFDHVHDYSYDGDHAVLRAVAHAAGHEPDRSSDHPRPRFLVPCHRAEGHGLSRSALHLRLAGAR